MEVYESAPTDVVLVYPRTLIADENGQVTETYEDGLDLRDQSASTRLRKLIKNLSLCNAVFGIVPTEALRQTRLLAPFVGSDEVLLAELSLLGEIWEVPERLFLRRLHAQRSLEAFPDPRDRTSWFDPSIHKQWTLPRTRILLADLHSVLALPLSFRTRRKATPALLRAYLSRWWKLMIREAQMEASRLPKRLRTRRNPRVGNSHSAGE